MLVIGGIHAKVAGWITRKITGGSKEIGLALASLLRRFGCSVTIIARDEAVYKLPRMFFPISPGKET